MVLVLLASASFLAACAAQHPVLYPNAKWKSTGQIQAQTDINQCTALARQGGVYASSAGTETVKSTAGAAAVGGAVGAVAGSVYGQPGRGAAAGAAGGAAGCLIRGLFRSNKHNPDPTTRRYIEQCLSDRGYNVLGWR